MKCLNPVEIDKVKIKVVIPDLGKEVLLTSNLQRIKMNKIGIHSSILMKGGTK